MRAQIFSSQADAERALAGLDAAAGLPRVLAASEWTIATPGRAAERIRARGVRLEHVSSIEPEYGGTRWALLTDGPGAVEIDINAWRGMGRRAPAATR